MMNSAKKRCECILYVTIRRLFFLNQYSNDDNDYITLVSARFLTSFRVHCFKLVRKDNPLSEYKKKLMEYEAYEIYWVINIVMYNKWIPIPSSIAWECIQERSCVVFDCELYRSVTIGSIVRLFDERNTSGSRITGVSMFV